jgi:hypothetical protein
VTIKEQIVNLKINTTNKAEDVNSVVDGLPGKHKALGLISSTTKKKVK